MKIDVLFNSHGLLIINKPIGIVTQGSRKLPQFEVSEFIPRQFPGYNIAHRIDRFTSGAFVCANFPTRKYLFKNWHEVTQKTYLAIIREPNWQVRSVDTEIDGKTAETFFDVLERKNGFALVYCVLVHNGRKHQIRKHLKSINSPIIGDRVYKGGGKSSRGGQLLHSWIVTFKMPSTNLFVQAPIPDDFKQFEFDWLVYDAGANQPVTTITIPDTRKR